MTENLLPAFNGQLDLRTAYNWNRSEVYEFLKDVVDNHANYGVSMEGGAELNNIRQHLLQLSLPDGGDFRAGHNLRPDQHIYRVANPAWLPPPQRELRPRPPRPPASTSKFLVRGHLHNGRNYWSPYDLLGLFLSSIGPAPDDATKRNFYLPMTAVYGRWCRQIAGRPGGGVGDLPYMFQCTWCIRSGQPTRFSLGSSLAGYAWKTSSTGTWRTVLKRVRFALVDGVPLRQAGYDFDNSPMSRQCKDGARFGNCAETYPFVDLLVGHNPNEETCHGLALQRDYLGTDDYQDMRSGVIWEGLCDPCHNCTALINWFGGDINNFLLDTESAGAPP